MLSENWTILYDYKKVSIFETDNSVFYQPQKLSSFQTTISPYRTPFYIPGTHFLNRERENVVCVLQIAQNSFPKKGQERTMAVFSVNVTCLSSLLILGIIMKPHIIKPGRAKFCNSIAKSQHGFIRCYFIILPYLSFQTS